MPITYTNRKRRTYHLCQGVTKRGKRRYYFSREPSGTQLEEIPVGYEVRESVNGVVSLARVRQSQLLGEEIETVKTEIQAHPEARRYRVDTKPKQIIIYEHVGPDLVDLVMELTERLGTRELLGADKVQSLRELEDTHGDFTAIMRFILADSEKRHFGAQRMSYLGGVDGWIDVEYSEPLAELASRLIPTLGTDEFFELF